MLYVYSVVAERGGRGAASGLWLEMRLCIMMTVMRGGDLVRVGVGVRSVLIVVATPRVRVLNRS